jgi:ferritin-like metal-binding protein YciE
MPITDALRSLDDLLLHELQDLYSAEQQLTEALPKKVEAASHADLKDAFQEHLQETYEQVDRLENVFDTMGKQPDGQHCEAMEGLISEAQEIIGAPGEEVIKDAALIAAAQRVEHYEIAGYGAAATYADELGLSDVESLLNETLSEEKSADKKLNSIATGGWLSSGINRAARQRS